MPLRLDVSAHEGFARVTATGRIDVQDIREHLNQARQLGTFRQPELVDATRVEAVGITTRELLSIAEIVYDALGSDAMAPRAIVVASPAHFRWARTFAGLVAGWMTVGVFTDRREALLWLEHRAARPAQDGAGTVASKVARRA